MEALKSLLERSTRYHRHLCPRQVLGVRMGVLAGTLLNLETPQPPHSKRLLVIVETDGCATDGVSVATNCWVGRRTLRVEDYGKVAATFIDLKASRAVRCAPRRTARQEACEYAPEARGHWEAMLLGYQRMPVERLLVAQDVTLTSSIEMIVSRPRKRAVCEFCGEEIMNEREIVDDGLVLSRACAGQSYYTVVDSATAPLRFTPFHPEETD